MTYKTHDARKRELALLFGRALLSARLHKGIGKRAIAEQTGISRNSLTDYERGRILPRFTNACRIADALGAEDLVRIARELRTLPCAVCAKPFINDGQVNTRFCSPGCHNVGQKKRGNRDTRQAAVRAERHLGLHREAVTAMCAACEPSGACRTSDCPLRIVSPLPLVEHREREVHAPPGRWGNGSAADGSSLPRKRIA